MSEFDGFEDTVDRVRNGLGTIVYGRDISELEERTQRSDLAKRRSRLTEAATRSRLVVAVASFVAVVAVIAPVAIWAGRGSGDPATPVTADGSPTAPLLFDVDIATLDWELGSVDATPGSLGSIVGGPAGLVAEGTDGQRTRVWLWMDEDGWVEQQPEVFQTDSVVRDLEAGEFGYLAAGVDVAEDAVPAIWFSVDAVSWSETLLPLPDIADRLGPVVSYWVGSAAGNERLMMVVGDEIDEGSGEPTPVITEAMLRAAGAPVDSQPRVRFLAGTSGSDVAVEMLGDDDAVIWTATFDELGVDPGETGTAFTSRPLAWISTDGVTWEGVNPPGWRGASTTGGVAANHSVFVAAIHRPDRGSELWVSSDGHGWSLRHQFDDGVFVRNLVGGPDGFVATTNKHSDEDLGSSAVWFSPEGSTWTQVGQYEPDTQVGVVAAGRGGGFALSTSNTADEPGLMSNTKSTVMISPDGETWIDASTTDPFGSGFGITGIALGESSIRLVGGRVEGEGGDQFLPRFLPEVWVGTP